MGWIELGWTELNWSMRVEREGSGRKETREKVGRKRSQESAEGRDGG